MMLTPDKIVPVRLVPGMEIHYIPRRPGEFSPLETQDLIYLAYAKFSGGNSDSLRQFKNGILSGERYNTLKQFKLRLRKDGADNFLKLVNATYNRHIDQIHGYSREKDILQMLDEEAYWNQWKQRMYTLQPPTLFEQEVWNRAVSAQSRRQNRWAIAS